MRGRQAVLLNRDIIRLFPDLRVSDSFLMKNNPDPIAACKIPGDLYGPAIFFVGKLNSHGQLLSHAFLQRYCENAAQTIGARYSCTYGGYTVDFF